MIWILGLTSGHIFSEDWEKPFPHRSLYHLVLSFPSLCGYIPYAQTGNSKIWHDNIIMGKTKGCSFLQIMQVIYCLCLKGICTIIKIQCQKMNSKMHKFSTLGLIFVSTSKLSVKKTSLLPNLSMAGFILITFSWSLFST